MGWRREDFGKRFADLLREHGWNPTSFAREHKFNQPRVREWAARGGRPSDHNLERIAAVFGVTVEWLLVGDEAKHKTASTAEASRGEEAAPRRGKR